MGSLLVVEFAEIGMAPNAGGEPRPIAGATQERKLLGVGSTAWLGGAAPGPVGFLVSSGCVATRQMRPASMKQQSRTIA